MLCESFNELQIKEVLARTNNLFTLDTTRTAQKTTRPTILVACAFIVEVIILRNRCLAMRGDTYIDRLMKGIYE
jgi:hypothetical protein